MLSIIFYLNKLYIMHLIRSKKRLLVQKENLSLILNKIAIKLSSKLKLLGIIVMS